MRQQAQVAHMGGITILSTGRPSYWIKMETQPTTEDPNRRCFQKHEGLTDKTRSRI
jgi:hypothetical protein